jgi:hypothetical protein
LKRINKIREPAEGELEKIKGELESLPQELGKFKMYT